MIITLKGADFSESNIGTLTTWRISTNPIGGVTITIDDDITSVDRETGASTTITGQVTVLSGYTLSSVVITMDGTDITSSCYDESTGAISITGITGNVVITATATSNSGSGDSGETEETTTWHIDHANQLLANNINISSGSGLGITVGGFAYMDDANALLVGKPINTVQLFVHTAGKFTFSRWHKTNKTMTEIQSFELANPSTELQTYTFTNEFTLNEGEYLAFGFTTDTGKTYYFYNIDFGSAYNQKLYYQVSASSSQELPSLCNLGMNIGYIG